MHFLFRSLSKSHSLSNHHRSFGDATIKHVRDRGLDHAVEREKNLKPIHDIKNMIKSEPSKSLPISTITERRDSLKIFARPIELIRKYPSVFEEVLPRGTGIHPHIKLTPELLNLDAEEKLVYESQIYKQDVADRLLKLLMLSRIHKIPLRVLEILKWDLGLPYGDVKSLATEFPDYFRIIGNGLDSALELVCWSDKMAVSVLERKAVKAQTGYKKGMPITFPMQFSRGFEMDKEVKNWVNEWQKLPYVSPYENSVHLLPTSDESDKWTTGVVHELLHLFVGKKAEKENLLCLGEHLGIKSRFKRVLLHHPGIFYVSSKIGTYTVVLRECYKRGLLIESNPLMNIRNQYLHLMHIVKEDKKLTNVSGGTTQQQQKEKTCGQDDDKAKEADASDDDYDEEEEDESCSRGEARKYVPANRGRSNWKANFGVNGSSGNMDREKSVGKRSSKARDKGPPKVSRTEMRDGRNSIESPQKSYNPKFSRTEMRGGCNSHGSSLESLRTKVSRRTEMHGLQKGHRNLQERSSCPRGSKRSLLNSTTFT
ncbi:PORR domain-containing protein [Cephalotus follicularis]|uniref:PORR domain-containing protein n=1 Tax=Cephalotus follicularis TaxID=3775 RepID=A0A1Q3BGD8_CEPFO|nr:PORR domain-containing protein [Cephalotus follicularis]